MAYLNLNTLEPVNFGGKECTPKIDAETKMRLSQIKTYDAKSFDILANAFPDDVEYVKDFLSKLTGIDVQLLHAYLLGGEEAVKIVKEEIEQKLSRAFEEDEADESEAE